jgi:hypothetical protein
MHAIYYLAHIIYDCGGRYPSGHVMPDVTTPWISTVPFFAEAPISKNYIFLDYSILVNYDDHIFGKFDQAALA